LLATLGCGIQTAAADEIVLAQTTQAGRTATYAFELRNDTAAAHDYRLALAGLTQGMLATFSAGGPPLDHLHIPATAYKQVALRIDVPAEAAVGRYAATFTAMRDDGVTIALPIALYVENTYALRVASPNVNVNTFSGREFTVEAIASNTGAAPVTNVALTVDAPARWVVQVDPGAIASLEPGGTASYRVRVLVPATEEAIDEKLTFAAAGDQASSPQASLAVRVQTRPNLFLYAGVISVLAMASVLVYFRIKGRR
jgi:uncharacterized membrane protein